ncbi:Hypothetical_protein [Hexamita inflata]|uniref:Hypothetical_protein n=1 Tax=Hexamita inflata TaxID=28002 RepID=A0AA86R9J2_9EUKA|nr:Hypothetical protein HINF_LOCUS61551 [Hexamita inflata]
MSNMCDKYIKFLKSAQNEISYSISATFFIAGDFLVLVLLKNELYQTITKKNSISSMLQFLELILFSTDKSSKIKYNFRDNTIKTFKQCFIPDNENKLEPLLNMQSQVQIYFRTITSYEIDPNNDDFSISEFDQGDLKQELAKDYFVTKDQDLAYLANQLLEEYPELANELQEPDGFFKYGFVSFFDTKIDNFPSRYIQQVNVEITIEDQQTELKFVAYNRIFTKNSKVHDIILKNEQTKIQKEKEYFQTLQNQYQNHKNMMVQDQVQVPIPVQQPVQQQQVQQQVQQQTQLPVQQVLKQQKSKDGAQFINKLKIEQQNRQDQQDKLQINKIFSDYVICNAITNLNDIIDDILEKYKYLYQSKLTMTQMISAIGIVLTSDELIKEHLTVCSKYFLTLGLKFQYEEVIIFRNFDRKILRRHLMVANGIFVKNSIIAEIIENAIINNNTKQLQPDQYNDQYKLVNNKFWYFNDKIKKEDSNIIYMMQQIQQQFVVIPKQIKLQEMVNYILKTEPWIQELQTEQLKISLGLVSIFNIKDKIQIDQELFKRSCNQQTISLCIETIELISKPPMNLTIVNGVFTKNSRIVHAILLQNNEQVNQLILNQQSEPIVTEQDNISDKHKQLLQLNINPTVNLDNNRINQLSEMMIEIDKQFLVTPALQLQFLNQMIQQQYSLDPGTKLLNINDQLQQMGLIPLYNMIILKNIDITLFQQSIHKQYILPTISEIEIVCNDITTKINIINGIFVKNSRIAEQIITQIQNYQQQNRQQEQNQIKQAVQQTNNIEQSQQSEVTKIEQQQLPIYIFDTHIIVNQIVNLNDLIDDILKENSYLYDRIQPNVNYVLQEIGLVQTTKLNTTNEEQNKLLKQYCQNNNIILSNEEIELFRKLDNKIIRRQIIVVNGIFLKNSIIDKVMVKKEMQLHQLLQSDQYLEKENITKEKQSNNLPYQQILQQLDEFYYVMQSVNLQKAITNALSNKPNLITLPDSEFMEIIGLISPLILQRNPKYIQFAICCKEIITIQGQYDDVLYQKSLSVINCVFKKQSLMQNSIIELKARNNLNDQIEDQQMVSEQVLEEKSNSTTNNYSEQDKQSQNLTTEHENDQVHAEHTSLTDQQLVNLITEHLVKPLQLETEVNENQPPQLDIQQIIIPEPELATKLEHEQPQIQQQNQQQEDQLVQSHQNQENTKQELNKPQIQNKGQTIENRIRSEFLLKFEKTQTALSVLDLIFTPSTSPSPQSQIQIQIVLKNLFDLTTDDISLHTYFNLKNEFLFNFVQAHHFKEGKVEVPFKNETEKQFFKEFAEILKFKFNNKFVFGFKKIQ